LLLVKSRNKSSLLIPQNCLNFLLFFSVDARRQTVRGFGWSKVLKSKIPPSTYVLIKLRASWGGLMFRAGFGLASLVAVVASVGSASAYEFGTRAEAVAMVKRVQEKFKKEGPDATFRSINEKKFNDRDLYPFVVGYDGYTKANGGTPATVGKYQLDLKDQDGKFLIRAAMDIAQGAGHGWNDYRWLNPNTHTIEDKSAYIERMGDNYLGVGIYKNEQPNESTIGIISGSPNSDDTYLQMAWDLADVLNDGDNLRILPIAGIGGPRNIRDVRYLKGIDIGLTQTSVLNNFRRSNERMGQIDNKIVYIAKLFNEEAHLVARSNITSINDLRGLKVNFDARGSGTSYSMRDIFKALGVEIQEVSMSQVEAFEKLKTGEIAATALIAGKPVSSISHLSRDDGLHLLSIPYSGPLIADYLPTTLSHDDYPELIPSGQTVDTAAVGAVLIAYDWTKASGDRYRRIQTFVEAFFSKIAEFQKPPRHVKWREVNVAATFPGWKRFEAAQAWLDSHSNNPPPEEQKSIVQTVANRSSGMPPGPPSSWSAKDTALYQEFLKWKQRRGER
jgi:uncharacterized protein